MTNICKTVHVPIILIFFNFDNRRTFHASLSSNIIFADRNKICPVSGGGQNILLGLQGTYIRTLFEAHVQMPLTAL
jgi:hypothetical protein